MSEEAQFPPEVYTHSVKISDTAKGIRIDVHVWATSREIAVEDAFQTYMHAQSSAKDYNIRLAPIEVKTNDAT